MTPEWTPYRQASSKVHPYSGSVPAEQLARPAELNRVGSTAAVDAGAAGACEERFRQGTTRHVVVPLAGPHHVDVQHLVTAEPAGSGQDARRQVDHHGDRADGLETFLDDQASVQDVA